ncbi:MAG TPA: DNA cytosine methyltransferase, partial [Thermoanaerobaculia bacterium]|nr:DNA cytosine methyltransferase [Thermoanaerobaculia bacterium]
MEIVGIDLFSGAGGLSLGAQEAGIRVALAIEADRHAALTYAHNLGSTEVLLGDIRMVTKSQLSKVALGAAITIVFGGAPCQGFSYSNQRTRNVLNEGNWLYLEFLRIVSICRPDWVVFENVKGIKDTEKGVFLADLLNRLSGLGYEVSARLLNAA